MTYFSYRDISKNGLLSFQTFLYWTVLGFCHAFVFFFGSYILMGEDTTLMGNGQVCHCIITLLKIPSKGIMLQREAENIHRCKGNASHRVYVCYGVNAINSLCCLLAFAHFLLFLDSTFLSSSSSSSSFFLFISVCLIIFYTCAIHLLMSMF